MNKSDWEKYTKFLDLDPEEIKERNAKIELIKLRLEELKEPVKLSLKTKILAISFALCSGIALTFSVAMVVKADKDLEKQIGALKNDANYVEFYSAKVAEAKDSLERKEISDEEYKELSEHKTVALEYAQKFDTQKYEKMLKCSKLKSSLGFACIAFFESAFMSATYLPLKKTKMKEENAELVDFYSHELKKEQKFLPPQEISFAQTSDNISAEYCL